MRIQVKTFGALTEVLEKEFYTTADDTTALLTALGNKYPELAHRKLLIAVNNTIVNAPVDLQENDVVALMPPYSGG